MGREDTDDHGYEEKQDMRQRGNAGDKPVRGHLGHQDRNADTGGQSDDRRPHVANVALPHFAAVCQKGPPCAEQVSATPYLLSSRAILLA